MCQSRVNLVFLYMLTDKFPDNFIYCRNHFAQDGKEGSRLNQGITMK